MPTMADVARVAGVSTTTVSHVLNRTRRVAPETEAAVRRAVETTKYRQNLAARAVATQSTYTIGLAMSVITNPNFADLVRKIESRLRDSGFTLVLADTNDEAEVALSVIDHLLERRVSGLIVNPLEGNDALTAALGQLASDNFPLLFLDRRSSLPVDQVYSEGVESTYLLTSHLAAQGHRRIGFVDGTVTSAAAWDRLEGYRAAVAQHGLDDDPQLVIKGESVEDAAHVAVLAHLSGPRPAGALVVSNNQMTLGTLRAVKALGRRIPDDIAMVCYDDFEWADLFETRITAMSQDTRQLADSGVDLLLSRLADPEREPQSIVVPTTFHHRESCGCPKQ